MDFFSSLQTENLEVRSFTLYEDLTEAALSQVRAAEVLSSPPGKFT